MVRPSNRQEWTVIYCCKQESESGDNVFIYYMTIFTKFNSIDLYLSLYCMSPLKYLKEIERIIYCTWSCIPAAWQLETHWLNTDMKLIILNMFKLKSSFRCN